MTWINYDDVLQQLSAIGLDIDKQLDVSARIQRWKTGESKGGEKPGWSRLKEWQSKAGNVYIVGCFGIWQGNDDGRMDVTLPKRNEENKLTDEDIAAAREARKAAHKAIEEERKREAKQAAEWAAQVWAKSQPVAEHEYLTRKQIGAHGARVWNGAEDLRVPGLDDANGWRLSQAVGALVVPMHNTDGNVCGIQFIYPKGHPRADRAGKEFWPTGMAMGGTFGVIGGLRRGGILLVAEGFATAASLHQATAQPVAYAFSANNLGKAAKLIRAKYKQLRILVCADDDYLTEQKTGKNPGVDAAQLAASAIELSAWIKPDFILDGRDLRDGKKLSDYNDLRALTGLDLVLANQINAKLDELKWRDANSAARGANTEGGGECNKDGRRRALSVMPLDDIVARFVPLDDGSGKYVFDTWTNKVVMRDQMVTLLPAGVRVDDIKRHPVWIERGAYYLDQVGFDPAGDDLDVKLNTWRGWPIKPKRGNCEHTLELLHYLCSGDPKGPEIADWILKWMAYPLQNPGAKMNSAIIMHGKQGGGKSTIFEMLADIYGRYSTVLNQRGIEDKFNSDWADSKLFILAEEVVTRAEMWHIKNELKGLVTGKTIRVNPKNIAAYEQKNHLNVVYLSNEDQPLPIENDDRRHLVVYTPPALDESYFDDVQLEIAEGGIAAFYDYLLHLDLTGFHPKKKPPMTDAKRALILLSMPSEQRFIYEWTQGEISWMPICPALANDVYAAYLRWCRINGEARPRPSNHFHGAVGHMTGWTKEKTRVLPSLNHHYRDAVLRSVIIPPESLLSQHGSAFDGTSEKFIWITQGVLRFAEALRGDACEERTGT